MMNANTWNRKKKKPVRKEMLRYFILFQISLSTIAQFSKAKKTTSLNCSDMYLFAVLFKLQIACPFHEKRYAFLKNKNTFCSKRYFVCFGMYFFLDFYMFRKETSPEKLFDIKAITFFYTPLTVP